MTYLTDVFFVSFFATVLATAVGTFFGIGCFLVAMDIHEWLYNKWRFRGKG